MAYNAIDEYLHEVRRCTTYLSHVGVEAPQYAEEGFYVGNEEIRPSELISQREERSVVPAMRRYIEDAAAEAAAAAAAASAEAEADVASFAPAGALSDPMGLTAEAFLTAGEISAKAIEGATFADGTPS